MHYILLTSEALTRILHNSRMVSPHWPKFLWGVRGSPHPVPDAPRAVAHIQALKLDTGVFSVID